jgi:hypothetical protein
MIQINQFENTIDFILCKFSKAGGGPIQKFLVLQLAIFVGVKLVENVCQMNNFAFFTHGLSHHAYCGLLKLLLSVEREKIS